MSTPDIIKYQDPKSVLVVNDKGKIRQVFTPFKVQCMEAIEHIPLSSIVYVEAVFMHKQYVLLYFINQRLFPYHHFRIQVNW